MNFTILRFDTIGSTNTEALRQARRGADEGLCILARQQTEGRGRHGRAWHSPIDAGLYFSIVLRPVIEMRFLSLVTLMTGVAVHDALEEIYKLDCDIKWANDILVHEKKICGILAESCDTNKGLAVVVGIGINSKSTNFPSELAEAATSVESEIKKVPNIEILLKALTKHLANCYETLQCENGAGKICKAWTEKSSYAFGKAVRVILENETIFGTTCGIETNGALRLETETGTIKIVQAGDVESLRKI